MERLWFIAIDTVRLRRALVGIAARAADGALGPAATAAGVRLVDACVVPCGMRAIAAASDPVLLRAYVRRFVAMSGGAVRWRSRFRAAPLRPNALGKALAFLERMRHSVAHDAMAVSKPKVRGANAARSLVTSLRLVERAVDSHLGADEAAARTRRYVAEHDAPPDDRAAFERLCVVIFAQGIGYDAVQAKLKELRSAFGEFHPHIVASFDESRATGLLALPIVRNIEKIRACVENARRWVSLANGGTYLGRVASVAATDDSVSGWPLLSNLLRDDFVRTGDSTARQALKRWGFFTAFAHPGVRRVLERLGLTDVSAYLSAVQLLLGSAAQRLGRDPYALEALMALFGGIGPCRIAPRCGECVLADRCPSAVVER